MHEFWVILVIAFGLAVDCFTVSLCIGSSPRQQTFRSIFRLSFHFGLFQGGMAYLGWLLGSTLAQFAASVDHWIALLLLLWVGGNMIREGLSLEETAPIETCEDRTRGYSLVMLSVATSIDSFGIGLSLAFMGTNIIASSFIIGIISLAFSIVGLIGGKRIGQRFGKKSEIFGGFVLILIGLRLVITHTIA